MDTPVLTRYWGHWFRHANKRFDAVIDVDDAEGAEDEYDRLALIVPEQTAFLNGFLNEETIAKIIANDHLSQRPQSLNVC